MSKISKQEIEKIAGLAKIKLSGGEINKYSADLAEILGYVEKLNEVDTKIITETSQVAGLENVYREDQILSDWKVDADTNKNTEKLLKNAKVKQGNYIKVKKILS